MDCRFWGQSCLPVPNIDRPSTSKELDIILSDEELDLDVESEDELLKDYNHFTKGVSEKSGPAIIYQVRR